jgi:hypothetical protein
MRLEVGYIRRENMLKLPLREKGSSLGSFIAYGREETGYARGALRPVVLLLARP